MKAFASHWNMAGKHPSFGDFLRIGREGSLMHALERWVEQGADRLGRDALDKGISWRMAMPQGKGKVVCGLVKDSRDSSGRAHPLLLAGELKLQQAGSDWTAAVLGCQAAWRGAEELSMRTFNGTEQLRQALALLPVAVEPFLSGAFTSSIPTVKDKALLQRNGLTAYSLSEMEVSQQDPVLLRTVLHRVTKRVPVAVFMGGFALDPLLIIVTRPLDVNDFVVLWTVTSPAMEQAWITDSSA